MVEQEEWAKLLQSVMCNYEILHIVDGWIFNEYHKILSQTSRNVSKLKK